MNKVILIGRLTKDPELRFTPGTGNAVTRFTLAVNRHMKKEEADFINCVAFGKTGEAIAQYLTKGRSLAITGNIRTGSYDAKDGTKRYTTDVIVESFEFINDGKKNEVNNGQANRFDNANSQFNDSYEDMMPIDDDIPF